MHSAKILGKDIALSTRCSIWLKISQNVDKIICNNFVMGQKVEPSDQTTFDPIKSFSLSYYIVSTLYVEPSVHGLSLSFSCPLHRKGRSHFVPPDRTGFTTT